jgi:hypothetical protein
MKSEESDISGYSFSYEDVYDENLTEAEIVNLVKKEILNDKLVIIGFAYRFCRNTIEILKDILQKNEQFNILLLPLIGDGNDGNLGEIEFKQNNKGQITTIIKPTLRFIDEKENNSNVEISTLLFNSFCDAVIKVGVFILDDELLTSI